MCYNMSFKLTEKEVLYLPDSDSHLRICEAFGLIDNKVGAERTHMSIGVIPLVSLESTNSDEWRYEVDTDRPYPAWYVEGLDKERVMKVAMQLIADGRYSCWEGDANLAGCSRLEELPAGFNPKGYVNFYGCSSLKALPAGFNPKGNVDLTGCSSLEELPAGFNPEGDVDLTGCSSLEELPAGFNPKGFMNLYGCSKITDEMVAKLTNAKDIYR